MRILAPPDLRFSSWEQRWLEKLASDPRFGISTFIVDGRQPSPRKSIYARLTHLRLPHAVIRRLTRPIVVEHSDRAAKIEVVGAPARPLVRPQLQDGIEIAVDIPKVDLREFGGVCPHGR